MGSIIRLARRIFPFLPSTKMHGLQMNWGLPALRSPKRASIFSGDRKGNICDHLPPYSITVAAIELM